MYYTGCPRYSRHRVTQDLKKAPLLTFFQKENLKCRELFFCRESARLFPSHASPVRKAPPTLSLSPSFNVGHKLFFSSSKGRLVKLGLGEPFTGNKLFHLVVAVGVAEQRQNDEWK